MSNGGWDGTGWRSELAVERVLKVGAGALFCCSDWLCFFRELGLRKGKDVVGRSVKEIQGL